MARRLEGRVAIVTGAGSVGPGWGNGRATAYRFAEEGAKVWAVDRHAGNLDETIARVSAIGGDIEAYACDVTKSADVAAMVQRCRQKWGHVDILVNNVGGSASGGPVELDEDVFDTQIAHNLKSAFLGCKYVLPIMEERRSGAIVNISSTSGLRWTGSAQVAYAAAKAAILQMSKVIAVQYASKGIRVNTVVPGQLNTPMVGARLANQRSGGDVQALLAQRQSRIPMGIMGDGLDTANAVVFLASDEAKFITAAEIVVDGGMTARCD